MKAVIAHPAVRPVNPFVREYFARLAKQIVGRPSFKARLLAGTRLGGRK